MLTVVNSIKIVNRLFFYPKLKQAIAHQLFIFASERTVKGIANNLNRRIASV
ncbi:MAG: hypothetical protein WCP16_01435 [Pseudanabaena sp. ELA645]|jgi:hypothetical protein